MALVLAGGITITFFLATVQQTTLEYGCNTCKLITFVVIGYKYPPDLGSPTFAVVGSHARGGSVFSVRLHADETDAMQETCMRTGGVLTDKENSACNALRQLSVAAALDRSVSESLSAAAQDGNAAGCPPGTARTEGGQGSATAANGQPSILSSRTSDVRMRLHALLEDL